MTIIFSGVSGLKLRALNQVLRYGGFGAILNPILP